MISIIDTIGNTPIIELKNIEKGSGNTIYAKLEQFNPFGSIKDRAAKQIIEDAENSGELYHEKSIVEATSGNMGIALSALSLIKGYKCTIVMPENASLYRKKIIKLYGANLILTPAGEGMRGSIAEAERISKFGNFFYTNQFSNQSCLNAHKNATAPELYSQLNGNIDYIIAGIGSGGTISGIGEYLKTIKPSIRIIGVLPDTVPHGITGLGAGFTPPILNQSVIDEILYVETSKASSACLDLLRKEGLFAGISSGAALSAAIEISRLEKNKNIVIIFPDGGERYI